MCYSDLPYLYTGRGLAELDWPYTDDPGIRARYEVMEYPVGISYFAYGTAVGHALGDRVAGPRGALEPAGPAFVGSAEVQQELRAFVIVNALAFAVLALLSAWLLAGVNPRRPWDAAAFAASPALLLTGLVNWDLLAVVLVAGALWTWARERPVLTGVLIGLGTATKLYPLFLLGGVLVICLRERRCATFALAAGAAAAAWVLANVPAYLTGTDEWQVFWSFNSERGPDLGSIWLVVQQADRTGDAIASTRTRSTTGRGRSSASGAWACCCSGSPRRRRRGSRSSASWSWPASCWSTRSTHRSTCCGCCRWRCWPGRAGATSSSGRPARSSTSPRCGGTSTATSRPPAGGDVRLLLGRDPACASPASSTWSPWSCATSGYRGTTRCAPPSGSGQETTTRSNAVAV